MDLGIRGQVALVTAGSRGLGRAVALSWLGKEHGWLWRGRIERSLNSLPKRSPPKRAPRWSAGVVMFPVERKCGSL